MALRRLDTDYLVIGAGAMGMAFTDALIDHADVHVTLVDRRHSAGGHWADAYPFVRLHQASLYYGVASTVLGTGAVQQDGPEAGLHRWRSCPTRRSRRCPAPRPAAFGLAADTMAAAADAESLDDLFVRLEAAGVMIRVDRDVMPTMAKTPTLGTWELDLLRTVDRVVRLGHIRHVTRDEIVLEGGTVPLEPGSLVVHCAASGLRYPPLVPIWEPDLIRIQTIRAGFPCFNAALTGYVEATRDVDRERNRLCPPNTLPDHPAEWAWMQVRGVHTSRGLAAEPDIAAWANACALNPARVDASLVDDPAVLAARARMADATERGLDRLTELAVAPAS